MVDRAKAQTVRDRRHAARVGVADDVSGVEEARFLETADRALVLVRGDDSTAEARLVDAGPRLAHDITPLEVILDREWLALVERPGHATRREEHAALRT